MSLDRNTLEQIADAFGLLFYLLIAGALFAAITSDAVVAFVFLILAACAHVGRWTLEEHVAARGEEARIEIDLQRIQDLLSRRRPL